MQNTNVYSKQFFVHLCDHSTAHLQNHHHQKHKLRITVLHLGIADYCKSSFFFEDYDAASRWIVLWLFHCFCKNHIITKLCIKKEFSRIQNQFARIHNQLPKNCSTIAESTNQNQNCSNNCRIHKSEYIISAMEFRRSQLTGNCSGIGFSYWVTLFKSINPLHWKPNMALLTPNNDALKLKYYLHKI